MQCMYMCPCIKFLRLDYVMDLWVIKTAKVNGKNRVFHLCSMCVVFVQVLCRNACTPFLINAAIFIKKNPLFSGNVV